MLSKESIISRCETLMKFPTFLSFGNPAAFTKAAEHILARFQTLKYSIGSWSAHPLNPKDFKEHATLNWIFVCDLLNFSFWQDDDELNSAGKRRFIVNVNGRDYNSYWSLPAVLNRALDSGHDIVNPNVYATISFTDLKKIFAPSYYDCTDLPLLPERHELLKSAGERLVQFYEGNFANFLFTVGDDAWAFINRLVEEFPSFRDVAPDGTCFLKRAQILVADIWAASSGHYFSKTINQLTIFADYRIPQVLCSLKLIVYGAELLEKVSAGQILKSGSIEEVEIRAASIVAADRLLNEMQKMDATVNAVLLDFYLWDYSQTVKSAIDKTYPFHKCRSIYY